MKLRLCVYNPLSAGDKCPGRREQIFREMKAAHVVVLTGAKLRLGKNGSPDAGQGMDGFRLFNWGYGNGRATNRHAGLTIGLSTSMFRASGVKQIISPPAMLQGRGGGLRIKTKKLDMLVIGIYPPPAVGPHAKWASSKVFEWAGKELGRAPERCATVLGGDLNAHVGLEKMVGGCVAKTQARGIGGCRRALCNENWTADAGALSGW